jgi:hypothetical protein
LYEINYGGSTEEIRRYVFFGAMASGTADKLKGFAEPDVRGPSVRSLSIVGSARL